MKVYEDFLYYGQGVYSHAAGEYLGLHCIAVIGYDDDKSAWIIKNSWTDAWGEHGFAYVAYNDCGIDSEYVFWDPIVARYATVTVRSPGPTRGKRASRPPARKN